MLLQGHGLGLGQQRFAPTAVEEVVDGSSLDPLTFHARYVQPRRPVLLRGVQLLSEAFRNWGDDEYLKDHFGDSEVLYEPKNEYVAALVP
jgi:hypothetical protein